MPANPKLTFN